MTETVPPTAGPGSMSHRQILTVFTGLMAAMLLASLDQTIVATALPTIVGELGGLSELSWVVTAYLLTMTVFLPLYGKLSDLFGRKRLFQFAITIFVIGSAGCALAGSMGQLIAFRALQGLGAGGITSLNQVIIGDLVSPRERGRYLGYIGAVYAVSGVAGPLLGGTFVDYFDWRWLFWLNVPIGVMALAVTQRNLRLPRRTTRRSIDYLGAASMSVAATALLLALVWAGDTYPWSSPVITGLAGLVALGLVVFVIAERRAPEPMLPPVLFRDRVFLVSIILALIMGAAMFAAISYVPLFLQVVVGTSATSSGLLLIPMVAGVLVTTIGSGRLVTRWGRYKEFPIAGMAILTVGMGLLATMSSATDQLLVSLYLVVTGLGVGLILQILVVAVQNAVPGEHLGAATSAVQFFRSIGATVGVAAFGALLNARLAISLPAGTDPAAARAGILSASDTALRDPLADAIAWGFRVAIPLVAVGFVLAWLLPARPLRTTTGH